MLARPVARLRPSNGDSLFFIAPILPDGAIARAWIRPRLASVPGSPLLVGPRSPHRGASTVLIGYVSDERYVAVADVMFEFENDDERATASPVETQGDHNRDEIPQIVRL